MKNFNFIFSVVFIFGILSLNSCRRDGDGIVPIDDLGKFESVDVVFESGMIGIFESGFKAASDIDSIHVMNYIGGSGSWVPVVQGNYYSGTPGFDNFVNPRRYDFSTEVDLPYCLRTENRFALYGLNSVGEVQYYGLAEEDLSNVSSGFSFSTNLFEVKSSLSVDVSDLVSAAGTKRYEFHYSYDLRNVDYAQSDATIPPTSGVERPVFYYEESGSLESGVLVVEGDVVTLDGIVVSDASNVLLGECFSSSAVDGVNFEYLEIEGVDTLNTYSFNRDWLRVGRSVDVRFYSNPSGAVTLSVVDNEGVSESVDLGELDWDLKEGLISWWDLANDALDSHGDFDLLNSGVIFSGDESIFDGISYMEIPDDCFNPDYNSFSFSIYVRLPISAVDGGYPIIHVGGGSGVNLNYYYTQINNNVVSSNIINNNDNFVRLSGVNIINDYEWHHIVVVRDREIEMYLLYVDGVLEAQLFEDVGSIVYSNKWAIGGYATHLVGVNPTGKFIGNMKNFGIWNRTLNLEEIVYLEDRKYNEL